MILKDIFWVTALGVFHTGVATVIAVSKDSEAPLTVGFTSCAAGLGLTVAGAFVGDYFTSKSSPDKHPTQHDQSGARIVGVIGYVVGSVGGYVLKFV